MYGGTDEAFQSHMANWMRHTPLAAVRQGADREEFVRDAEKSGGRPVRTLTYDRRLRVDAVR